MQRLNGLGLCALFCALVVGCGDTQSGDESVVGPDAVAEEDTGWIEEDTAQPDTNVGADTAPSDTAVEDTGAPDAGGPVCPGGADCPCDGNDACDAGLCLEGSDGKRCAKPCVDSCAKGFVCAQVPQGSDVVTVCVDAWARLCSPCAETKDCQLPGVTDARCIDRGELGAFCGAVCDADGDCPTGYACKAAKDVDGNTTSQCLPVSDEGELAACSCSKNAVALAFKGACSKAVLQGDKELVCSGEVQCKNAGQAPECTAKQPVDEKCDGVDNDCDGDTDEAACDDANTCTTDSCDPNAGPDKACSYKPLTDGSPCDADGSVCTENDVCKAGQCEAGPLKLCDDGNPCTKDSCDLAAGCTQVSDDGAPCSDDNPCTLGDVCAASACKAGVGKTCDSGNPCVLAKCDLKDGKCKFEDATDGANCDDGDACSQQDACMKGSCKGKGLNCDDGNPCTADSCDKSKGCQTVPTPGKCEDGDPCTEGDLCQGGKCSPGKPICKCKKDSDCQDDGNLCNGLPYCDTSAAPYLCKVKPSTVVTCDPKGGTLCSPNTCVPATGKCAPKAVVDGTSCSDDDACTSGDTCKAGKCASGAAVTCKDSNFCTKDSCDKAKGCVFDVQIGLTQVCYDGAKGTEGVGTCVSGKKACDAKGVLGPCQGAVLPAKTEACDGKDDDCDGQTDEICSATGVAISQAPLVLNVSGSGKKLEAAMQTGPVGASKGAKVTVDWSLEALWRLWWPK